MELQLKTNREEIEKLQRMSKTCMKQMKEFEEKNDDVGVARCYEFLITMSHEVMCFAKENAVILGLFNQKDGGK